MNAKRPPWGTSTKLAVFLLLLAGAIFLLWRFSDAIRPFIIAAIIAYVLSPLVSLFQRRLRLPRALATFLAYLVLLAMAAAIPLLIIPPLTAQASDMNLNFQRLEAQAEALMNRRYLVAGQLIDLKVIFEQAVGSLRGVLEPLFGRSLELAVEAISSLVWIIFTLVVSFYLTKDGPALQAWLEKITPHSYREDYLCLRGEIALIWNAFFRGQLVLALVVAGIFTTLGLALGLPFALVMGVLAGLLEFLPSIGHAIWLTIVSILAFFIGSAWLPLPNWAFMLVLIAIHLVFQQFDLNYLIPRIIGRRVHLPPLVVILGIVSGALLAGFLGIFLAAPTIASARVVGRYLYANLFDQEPFVVEESSPLPAPNPRFWKRPAPKKETSVK